MTSASSDRPVALMHPPRRRWLVGACLVVMLLALALIAWWLQPVPRVGLFTWGQYQRIEVGMTVQEAGVAMGRPAGHYSAAPITEYDRVDQVPREGRVLLTSPVPSTWRWKSDDAMISVLVEDDGRIACKRFAVRVPAWKLQARAWLARLRGLVGL